MSYWLTDPELFLYVKGTDPDDVHLWRCKKPASSSSSSSSSLVVPMKSDDFDYVSNVKNHLELIANLFDWDETDYKRLVKYIYKNHLLVNSQGFVIAELLHKADKDGNKTIDDANEDEDVLAMYIRSLDVLPLKPYIPKLRERPIPLRTVKYLGDVNGKVAMMEEDSNVTKLTARVDTLDINVADLQSKNKNLEAENKTLDSNVKTLEGQITKLTSNVADLQSKNKNLEAENKTLEGKVTKLTTYLMTLEGKVTMLIADQGVRVWMNDNTNSTDWVGVEGLRVWPYNNLFPKIIASLGTFTVDENWTNVRARHWYPVNEASSYKKAVCFEDLTPNKEKARFRYNERFTFKSEGKTYVLSF